MTISKNLTTNSEIMKLGVMQPYFFPYIGYFQLIKAVDKYILYENLTFRKKTWMNRNQLMFNNGNISTFSVPLISKSSNTLIKDIKIDNTQKWSKKLLKTIFFNYKHATYFEEIYPLFKEILLEEYQFLYLLNAYSIISISSFLDIKTEIQFENRFYLDMERDLNTTEMLSNQTKPINKVKRIITMCENEFSKIFVNAIGGQELYSKEEFAQYGIQLKFIQTNTDIIYPQFSNVFIPNLSIIDVLMHNGKNGSKNLLNKYYLI